MLAVPACNSARLLAAETQEGPGSWTALFNGKDLTGWIPKVKGHELGVDPARTFRGEIRHLTD